MFYSSWYGIARILVVGVCGYASLILLLQISGKRTLSKMSAFDLVVTVALGSTLSSLILSKDTPLAEGVAAFALLIALQFLITWASVRSRAVRRLVKSEPTLLYFKDGFIESAMERERVTEEEIHAAARSSGCGSMREVEAVVLETDGSFSIVKGDGSACDLCPRQE